MHGRLGRRHEGVDVGLGLHDRAHVVMIAELQTFVGDAAREFRHPRAERRPVAGGQLRALRQRRGAIAVDGVGAFGGDHHVGPGAFRHRDMGLRALELLARRAAQQFRRIPAADENEAELGELGLERGAVVGQLVALLHALEAGLPGFGQAGFERRVAADFL